MRILPQAPTQSRLPQRGAVGCIVAVLFLLLALGGVGALALKRTNAIAAKELLVQNSWREVHIQYARRLDVVRLLLGTAEGQRLKGTPLLQGMKRGRAAIDEVQLAEIPRPADQEALAAFLEAQGRFTTGLERLKDELLKKAGPKPSDEFTRLMTELEFAMSRIRLARRDFYDAVWSYNSALLRFPDVFLAKIAGYLRSPEPEERIPGEVEEDELLETFFSGGQG